MLFVFMLPTLLCCLIIPSSRPLPPSPQIWLGGLPNQTRLAQVFLEKVKVQDLEEVLEPVFAMWKARGAKESFGSFVNRVVRATVKRVCCCSKWRAVWCSFAACCCFLADVCPLLGLRFRATHMLHVHVQPSMCVAVIRCKGSWSNLVSVFKDSNHVCMTPSAANHTAVASSTSGAVA